MQLVITRDTLGKVLPQQSRDLKSLDIPNQIAGFKKGRVLKCSAIVLIDGGVPGSIRDDHYFAQFDEPVNGAYRWFFYPPDVQVEEPEHTPSKEALQKSSGQKPLIASAAAAIITPEPREITGPTFDIPGIAKPVTADQPIFWGDAPSNFTWGEATKNGTRIPVDASITENIIYIAKRLQKVRDLFRQPVIVTSWYRPPDVNWAVGGASRSRHLVGDAVDFYIPGISSADTFRQIRANGLIETGGAAPGPGFTHIDGRSGIARWLYSGGPQISLW